jgi:cytoskeletal protein CcmA (bactofilin family)
MKRSFFVVVLIALLLLLPTGMAFAGTQMDTIVTSGETINNDITLFEGDLEIEAGATVNGDVTLFDGDAEIAGTVNGNLVLFSGDLDVAETAVINGDCVVMSGNITDDTTNQLSCTNLSNFSPELPAFMNQIAPIPPVPPVPDVPAVPGTHEDFPTEYQQPSGFAKFVGGVAGAATSALVMGLLAFGVATLFPQHLTEVGASIRRKPVAVGTVGFLTGFAVPILLTVLTIISAVLVVVCIGLLGFPIVFALSLAFAGAIAFGWIATGTIVGQWLAGKLNMKNRSLPVTTALGVMALTFTLGLLSAIPFVIGESLVSFVVACVGLGGVALTKFGTRPYPFLGGLDEINIVLPGENSAKVASVLDTLPDDPRDLKQ